MSAFFLPDLLHDNPASERAYRAFRDQAEACTGAVCRDRRIRTIECRQHGVDRELSVGEPDAANGKTVAAILQLGRGTYTVHHLCPAREQPADPTVLQRTEVYSVTNFD